MTEERGSTLVHEAERFLGISVRPAKWLEGGDQALVLHVETDTGPLVLHASPEWRTRLELEWVHRVARHARAYVPEAVAPVECAGQTVFDWQGRPVAAFPFVAGEALDRDDPVLRMEAARLLAAIHTALLSFSGGSRPGSVSQDPLSQPDPTVLLDRRLDAWWRAFREQRPMTGLTHGDYYRRNVLTSGQRIVGVIDWHEADIRPLALELAGATFELCRDDAHVLHLDRAAAFVTAYRHAGGPIPDGEIAFLLPLIRVWVRSDVRMSLSNGEAITSPYVSGQIRAFRQLLDCAWVPPPAC